MQPTNNPDERRQTANCTRLCQHCGVSECVNISHQPWPCVCGHERLAHIHPGFATHFGMFPTPLGYAHPHRCVISDCDCDGLVYMTPDFFEQMLADLEQVVTDTSHPRVWDDSEGSDS